MSESFENPENSWIRKKILVFLVCIVISTLFWFLVVLSKDYNDVLTIPVKYVNIPKGKVIVNELPAKVTVELRSFGFNLIKFRLINPEEELLIDVSQQIKMRNPERGFIVTNSRLDRYSSQMNGNIQLVRITPDTLFFDFDTKQTNVVTVKPNIDVSFGEQFYLSGQITVKPERVQLIGGSRSVDTMTVIQTEKLVLSNLEQSQKRKVKVQIPASISGVVSDPPEVEVSVPIDKFTEASVSVPVKVENIPEGFSVRTYPENVKIVYLVALSNFDKVKADQFEVSADFSAVTKSATRIKAELTKTSPFVRNVRIQPEKVEFILIKR